MFTFPSDIEIAQSAHITHIREIASKLQIAEDDLEYYGKYKAKLPLSLQKKSGRKTDFSNGYVTDKIW